MSKSRKITRKMFEGKEPVLAKAREKWITDHTYLIAYPEDFGRILSRRRAVAAYVDYPLLDDGVQVWRTKSTKGRTGIPPIGFALARLFDWVEKEAIVKKWETLDESDYLILAQALLLNQTSQG